MANGALGGLLAYIDNLKRKAGRNIDDMRQRPADWERMAAARWKQDLREQMSKPEAGLDFVAGPLGAVAGVVKNKGGNWIGSSVDQMLQPLMEKLGETSPAALAEIRQRLGNQELGRKGEALGQWVQGPLRKYIMRDMATEGDPVRKLIEQGVSHKTLESLGDIARWDPEDMLYNQRFVTKPSTPERGWEHLADNKIQTMTAKDFSRIPRVAKAEPWLQKSDPQTIVHAADDFGASADELGFSHMLDELDNALDPNSGLPRELLLRPEQMQQMGMEKAVRHVNAINEWRAAQKIEANKELANKAMSVREYAENNPKGLRWVELGADEELAKMYKEGIPSGDAAAEAYKTKLKALEDQLKYEGDTMGHCVGGYCPDVLQGKSRIFSLRDAKGEPHVTVEVAPSTPRNEKAVDYWFNHVYPEGKRDELFGRLRAEGKLHDWSSSLKELPEYQEWAKGVDPAEIIQIKGKQNLAPNEDYLPFVQDFVRNSPLGGGWGRVGDISNTGLVEHMGEYITKEELARRAAQVRASGDQI